MVWGCVCDGVREWGCALLWCCPGPQVEERIECTVSGRVRYTQREDRLLTLPVSMEAATNKSDFELHVLRV